MRLRLPASSSWALAALGLLTGCANYQLGAQGRLAFTTLYVAPVQNKTLLAQAQAAFSTQLRTAFLEDGRVQLVNSPAGADATLQVVITDYHRDVAAQREQDTGLASKFVETVGTTCTLRDNRSGKALFENRKVNVQRSVFTDNGNPGSPLAGDQLLAESNTVPLFAEQLANRVAHTVLDVW